MYDSDWWGAWIYLMPPEGDGVYPDMKINFSGLRRELAEQALSAMVRALADQVGITVRVTIPNGADHPAHNRIIAPSADK